MDWRDRISIDPNVCHGKPCIKGTRILVSIILANLDDGVGWQDILKSYPTLQSEDLHAALQYSLVAKSSAEACIEKFLRWHREGTITSDELARLIADVIIEKNEVDDAPALIALLPKTAWDAWEQFLQRARAKNYDLLFLIGDKPTEEQKLAYQEKLKALVEKVSPQSTYRLS